MNLNWPRMAKERKQRLLAQAREHLRIACSGYELQYRAGRVFMHEHPKTASSWAEPVVKKLLNLPGINRYHLDMCAYDLRTDDGSLVKKPTSVVTNSAILGKHLAKKCPGNHQHSQLKGGHRCQHAAIYTQLLRAGGRRIQVASAQVGPQETTRQPSGS